MSKKRTSYNASTKAKIAFEAAKQEETIAQISSKFEVHPNQISRWKKHLLDNLPSLFSSNHKKKEQDTEKLQSELYQKIGQLEVELDWLKKKSKLFSNK